jgi:hypothetical protein
MNNSTNNANSMKNTKGLDAYDLEAEKAGQALRTLDSYRPYVSRKKTCKVRIDNFLREKALI